MLQIQFLDTYNTKSHDGGLIIKWRQRSIYILYTWHCIAKHKVLEIACSSCGGYFIHKIQRLHQAIYLIPSQSLSNDSWGMARALIHIYCPTPVWHTHILPHNLYGTHQTSWEIYSLFYPYWLLVRVICDIYSKQMGGGGGEGYEYTWSSAATSLFLKHVVIS